MIHKFFFILSIGLSTAFASYAQKKAPSFISISRVDTILNGSASVSYSISNIDSLLKITKVELPIFEKYAENSFTEKVKKENFKPIITLFTGKLTYLNNELIVMNIADNSKMMNLSFDEQKGEITIQNNKITELNGIDRFGIIFLLNSNGQIQYLGYYQGLKRHGKWKFRNENGIYNEIIYDNGTIVK